MGSSHWHHWCRSGEPKWILQRRQREGGEPRNGGKVGGVFVAMAKGPLSSCWFACAVAHPFPFFLLPPSFSHLCSCQPFRQEICTLRGWLWTFLLQSFYAIRHTQGWETLSSKHRERILAGKEGKPLFFTQWSSALWFLWMLFLPNPF